MVASAFGRPTASTRRSLPPGGSPSRSCEPWESSSHSDTELPSRRCCPTPSQERANLEYPRRWAEPQDPQVVRRDYKQFRERGLVSTRGVHGLVLEVPLGGDSPSRMFDPKAETALLKVSTDVPHPLAGVGYAATIALPYDPASADIPSWCRRLNDAENAMQDFVPRLGAWAMRSLDRELVYSLFWPTDRSDTGLPRTIMNWLVTRTMWLQERYWEPGVGLVPASEALMPEVAFAPFAEDFIGAVGTVPLQVRAVAEAVRGIAANQSRIYDVEASDGPVESHRPPNSAVHESGRNRVPGAGDGTRVMAQTTLSSPSSRVTRKTW